VTKRRRPLDIKSFLARVGNARILPSIAKARSSFHKGILAMRSFYTQKGKATSFRASIFLAESTATGYLADRQILVGIAWREDERFKGYPW
jgi:hypothetical protein